MTDITTRPFSKQAIKEIECRFAVYIPPALDTLKRPVNKDYHLVKEVVHLQNGETVPYVHFIENFERTFGVTRPAHRKHKSKKEWEELKKLQLFKTTQSRLLSSAARALEQPWFSGSMRRLARSQSLYGTDIESTALVKKKYQRHFTGESTLNTVAAFDIEADMIKGHGRINMATLSFKSKMVTAITAEFLEGISNPIPKLRALMEELLGDVVKARNIDWEIKIVKNDLEVIRTCFNRAHEWSPDFVSIWNMDYDVPKMVECIESYGLDPKDFFSDPRLPKENRFWEYKRGQSQKVTESGKVTPIKPAARWHTVFAPCGFYFIDSMCTYRQLRTGQGEEPSYSLDAILNKTIKRGKLKFEKLEESTGPDWHIAMQSRHPLEYVIYNTFDVIGLELHDEEVTDLSVSLPMQAGPSDWRNFNSQPRRVCDELHFYCLDNDHMVGTTSDAMEEPFDKLTISLRDWIVMLPAHPVIENGLQLIIEFPFIYTNVHTNTGDLDVKASYPLGECVFNVSKETTHRELIRINGVTEHDRRMQGINMSGGCTNALEIMTVLFKMPTQNEMLNQFMLDEGANEAFNTLQ